MQLRAFLIAGFAALSAAAPAGADGICVTCTGPEATYNCAIAEGDEALPQSVLRTADKLLRYVCAVELAKQGGHEKCRARRQTAEPCIGSTRFVSLKGQQEQPAGGLAGGEPGEPNGESKEGEGPPKTMLELAKRTADASNEQLKKAGDAVKGSANSAGEKLEQAGEAVGGAVKKSWQCLASLFKEC